MLAGVCCLIIKDDFYAFRESKSLICFAVDIMLGGDTRTSMEGLWQTYDDHENATSLMFLNARYTFHSSRAAHL